MIPSHVRFPETLFVLRHGQTQWNLQKRLQGRIDIPLNETGCEQARINGLILKKLLKSESIDPKCVCIRSSPLSRAMQTAQIACRVAQLPAPIIPEPKLAEQCYGELEGMTHDQIRRKYPYCWYMRLHDPLSYTPPHGESGEMFQSRISTVIDSCREITLLVGHFGLLRTLIALCQTNGVETDINFETLTGAQDVVYMVRNGKLTLHGVSQDK